MRKFASSLLVAWMAVSSIVAIAAAGEQTAEQKSYGVLEETPNQRRVRLGQPIVASYPPPDYGVLMETPNQRRIRLGLALPEADEFGVTRETPNQARSRTVTASLQ